MRRTVVAGHVCVDLAPRLETLPRSTPGDLELVGPLGMTPGGCVSNTGGMLAELGAPVEVVGDAGDDELGRTLVRLLTTRGVDTDGIRLLPGRSTSYSVVVQPTGLDRSFWHHAGANAEFDGAAIDLADAGLLHLGYPQLLPALAADKGAGLHALLSRARGGRAHHVARPGGARPGLARGARGLAGAPAAGAAARRRPHPEHRRPALRSSGRPATISTPPGRWSSWGRRW